MKPTLRLKTIPILSRDLFNLLVARKLFLTQE